jgi:hypothetical protein
MSARPADELARRVQSALDELQSLVLARYPDATFRVVHSPDDPAAIHLLAMVNVEDTDAVLDVVVDRMMELQIAEGLPLYVIPVRSPERVLAMRGAVAAEQQDGAGRVVGHEAGDVADGGGTGRRAGALPRAQQDHPGC